MSSISLVAQKPLSCLGVDLGTMTAWQLSPNRNLEGKLRVTTSTLKKLVEIV